MQPGVPALNLLVITLDTVRADHIGAYGYRLAQTPHLDRLAREGVMFEQAVTAVPLTLPSHCSLFTGRFPVHHGVHDNSGPPLAPLQPTLASILRASGYRTGAFVASDIVNGTRGLSRGFEIYFGDFPVRPGAIPGPGDLRRPANEVVNGALRWLDGPNPRPFFAWIHFYDAHAPYEPPEPFRSQHPGRPYDGAIAFADSQVGRLVAFLGARELLDRTIIVVMGDHGEGLGEHGEWTHALFAYDSVLRVPLVIRVPHARSSGRRVAAVVRSVDVMPTVLDLLGIPAPAAIDGVSLVRMMSGSTAGSGLDAFAENMYPRLHLRRAEIRVVRSGRFKLIEGSRPELYDIELDPHELHDLHGSRPALEERLEHRLRELVPAIPVAVPAPTPGPPDPDSRARLAALGYISR
jgi:arylsulfatase A-like enzyme